MTITVLSVDLGDKIHPSKKVLIAYLKVDEAPIKLPSKYADFVDVFLPKLAVELSEYTEINNYVIELVDD